MSIRSLLVEFVADVMKKVFQRTTRLERSTTTEKTNIARLSSVEYALGCSAVAEVSTIKVLEHGGKYPQILDPDTRTEEIHKTRVVGELYDFGCSPVTQVNAVKGLKHGSDYPSINES